MKNMIFLAGLHRSGTSLLHEIIRSHPEVTGFRFTFVPEDEGQHLQSVYPTARKFGGPGKFAFSPQAYMDEIHPLATVENASLLLQQWGKHLNPRKNYIVEKSPPTLIRTRFFQKLFPDSCFIVILRHPIAVAYASQSKKWCGEKDIAMLLEHSLKAYEIFLRDMSFLRKVYVIRYEEFIMHPQMAIDAIFRFIGLPPIKVKHKVHTEVNAKYFKMWMNEAHKIIEIDKAITLENDANQFGYSFNDVDNLLPIAWINNEFTRHPV